MKLKFRNALLVSFLAIAGFFGVSSTLINQKTNEQSIVEKAEAAGTTAQNQDATMIYTKDERGYSFCTVHLSSLSFATDSYSGHTYDSSDLDDYFAFKFGTRKNQTYSNWAYQNKNGPAWCWFNGSTGNYLICPSKVGDSNYPIFEFYLPWWVTGGKVQMTNGNDGWLPGGWSDQGTNGYEFHSTHCYKGYLKMYYNSQGQMFYSTQTNGVTADFDAYNITIAMKSTTGTSLGNFITNEAHSSFDYYYPTTNPSYKDYSFSGLYTNSTLTTSYTASKPTADKTLYAKMTPSALSIPVHFIVDGVYQDRLDGGTTINGTCEQYFSAHSKTLYGYQFDGFYSSWSGGDNFSGYLNDTKLSSDYTSSGVYCRLSALSTNKTYYIYTAGYENIKASASDPRPLIYYRNADNSENLNDLYSTPVQGISNVYRISLPEDVALFHWQGKIADYKETVNSGTLDGCLDPGNHNLFVVTGYDSTIYKDTGEWIDIAFYLDVSSDNFVNYDRHDMHEPTDLSNLNIAEASEISISSGQKVRGYALHPGMGDGYTTYTTQGADVTNWSSLAYSGSTKSFNFYLASDGKIYIVDNTDIQNGGYLYISDFKPLTDVHITVQVNSSTPYNSARLSTIENVSSSTGKLIFNGVGSDDGSTTGYLLRVPVYNLRGKSSVGSDTSYTVTLVGTVTKSSISVPINTKNYNYYINLASAATTYDTVAAGASDNPVGLAAKCAFAADKYIDGCKYSSVCAMPQATALVIKGYYEAVSGTGSTLLSGTKIRTWGNGATYETVKNGTYTTIEAVNFSVLYASRILPIATGSVSPLSAIRSFSPFDLFGNNENNLSIIIIIVASSIALLSVTALSILVIKKRKNKEE